MHPGKIYPVFFISPTPYIALTLFVKSKQITKMTHKNLETRLLIEIGFLEIANFYR
jgi:hypothetical protein